MASSTNLSLTVICFFVSLFLQQAQLGIVCHNLPNDKCAFAIDSNEKRCLLETAYITTAEFAEYQCRTFEVYVRNSAGYVETDGCVKACGIERQSIGISSDSLLEPSFISKLCSSACYKNCPNIVDLYFNLASGEGGFLPEICASHRASYHHALVEVRSSRAVASDQVFDGASSSSPSPSPSQLWT
uniref:PAR1 protein n=1 Tax=Kalanchoe fedtschenkoi TaxID=63787 RepID=A0A7N0RHH9_KALFE